MKEVELKIHDMSSTLYPADAYALVLEEVDGGRKLPIIIGHMEAQAIKVMMVKYLPPRPLTHDLFLTVTRQFGIELKKILIYKAKDGVFYSYLYYDKDGEEYKIDSRTSDAIALALRYKCPMYTTEDIMETEHLHDLGEGKFSVPITSVSVELLEDALQKAIDKEDYETASQIRDEIRKRKENL
ncbi:MAG: bifunctional nuclease family protein [Bacteroides sp.]|nr:bifunctional nuclease family protein [Bacteroides sp.]